LQRDAEIAQIVERDMKNDIAVMKVGGVGAAIADRNRPSAFK
jgi:hypothetical protein